MRDELRLAKLDGDKDNNIPTTHAPDAGVVEIIKCMERLNVSDMLPLSPSIEASPSTHEVRPITIRKTPKFPSRDRHLAIRRKKAATTTIIGPVEQHQQLQSIIMGSNNSPDDVTKKEKEETDCQELASFIGSEE